LNKAPPEATSLEAASGICCWQPSTLGEALFLQSAKFRKGGFSCC
jgi:hypothetical protein